MTLQLLTPTWLFTITKPQVGPEARTVVDLPASGRDSLAGGCCNSVLILVLILVPDVLGIVWTNEYANVSQYATAVNALGLGRLRSALQVCMHLHVLLQVLNAAQRGTQL